MLDVTAASCGEWIPGYTSQAEMYRFYTNVIELAIENGMEQPINYDADCAVLLASVADNDTLTRIDNIYWDALYYLNDLLPDNFWFESEEWGLYLLTEAPDGSIIGY